ncbi:MAG TPA: alpha/beta fold hydrolase [Burkholderiales bacterium]|nr:alpha/beta fold hydrolase [Burkholderiales bacterium]
MKVEINGAHIHYRREGSGFPIVMLHAGVADSRMWQPQADEFATHFDVIRPDMRGFGDSELPPVPWTPRDDLLALMDVLRIKPAHLVGCSMGGSLAIDFAIDHPERVSKLVLVGAGLSGAKQDPRHEGLYAEVMAADERGDMNAVNQAEMYLWLDGPHRARGYVAQPLRDLFLDMNGKNLDADWSKAPMQALEPGAANRLSEITAPTLVIVGDADLEPIRETADLLASSIVGARKKVIHDAAHLPNLEHPEEFNRIVLDFLKS